LSWETLKKIIRIQRTDYAWYYVLKDHNIFVQDEEEGMELFSEESERRSLGLKGQKRYSSYGNFSSCT
jgi:hypothetical protein